jgi:hypothetical protein
MSKPKIKREKNYDSTVSVNAVREIRQSTKEKTVDSDVARQKSFKIKVKSRPPLRHQFSQRELLMDALETEVFWRKNSHTEDTADLSSDYSIFFYFKI